MTEFARARETRAARSIAAKLRPAEDAIDASILASAELMATITKVRIEAGIPFDLGERPLVRLQATVASMVAARQTIADCHRELARARDVRGLDEEQVGCTLGKDPKGIIATEEQAAA